MYRAQTLEMPVTWGGHQPLRLVEDLVEKIFVGWNGNDEVELRGV